MELVNQRMPLHRVPDRSLVRVVSEEAPPPGALPAVIGEVYKFHHIDGMYSYCHDSNGKVVHLKAWTEVEVLGPIPK